MSKMAVVAAEHRNVAAAVVFVIAVAVDIGLAVTYLLSYKEYMMLEESAAALDTLVLVVLYSFLSAPLEIFEAPEKRLAQSIHSFHDRDRWHRGYVLVEVAEILTWAERGKPLSERCRTPLWASSDRERIAPDLIFPAVHRARCTNYRRDALRIAWKWPVSGDGVGPRSSFQDSPKPSLFLIMYA
jgi:hypothetical protein